MRALPPLDDSCQLEHRVAQILTEQEIHGWTFNEQKAQQTHATVTSLGNQKPLDDTPHGCDLGAQGGWQGLQGLQGAEKGQDPF